MIAVTLKLMPKLGVIVTYVLLIVGGLNPPKLKLNLVVTVFELLSCNVMFPVYVPFLVIGHATLPDVQLLELPDSAILEPFTFTEPQFVPFGNDIEKLTHNIESLSKSCIVTFMPISADLGKLVRLVVKFNRTGAVFVINIVKL